MLIYQNRRGLSVSGSLFSYPVGAVFFHKAADRIDEATEQIQKLKNDINRIQKEGLSNVIGEIDDLTKDIIELSKYIYEYYIERMKKEEEKKSGKKY